MKIKYSIALLTVALMFSSCEKFLDRPQLTAANDDNAWTTEENVRLYANKYYTDFFEGYGSGFDLGSSYLLTFSDDVVRQGNQTEFTLAVPNSGIWSYTSIRSINIMLDRVENRMSSVLSTEAYNHWTGIGRFFRAMAYSDLVFTYGDVPYYDKPVSDTDFDALFKDRTPRNEVMDAVYEDLKFALENVRTKDGNQTVNRYVVAGFISRIALAEGSWQKYYYQNNEQAKKFLELAERAGNLVISSGGYDILTDYRSQFTSENLKDNKDMILYREYNESMAIRHSLLSTHNLSENVTYGPSSDLVKSFICVDGSVWQNSGVANADNFVTSELFKSRDSRFEAMFHENPTSRNRASFLYITKFLPRDVEERVANGAAPGTGFSGASNTTDAPVLRYAEVLLNWIEAKAELATLGGVAVSQSDIDRSINKIRTRPLSPIAEAKGVTKTAALNIGTLPVDPERDVTVSALLWEIRRERRMELAFESSRLSDLKRWKKLDYMDTDTNPDLLAGGWVDFPGQLPDDIKPGISVVKLNGQVEVYNPENADSKAKMVGFYRFGENRTRQQFLGLGNVNPYLTPIGRNQINEYAARGYVLTQTEGWPQN